MIRMSDEYLDSQLISEDELAASICQDSFYAFVEEFWDIIITDKFSTNWHIKKLCDILQENAERVFAGLPKLKDIIINIPPGTTKSTIVSVMFPAWIYTRMVHARIIVATHTQKLGFDLSTRCRKLLRSQRYRAYFPSIMLQPDQDTKGYWQTTGGGYRMVATVGGENPVGFHGHFLIIDDPIDPVEALSENALDKANHFMKDSLDERKVDKKVTLTILVMQRLHQNDPTGNWLARDPSNVFHICLPATTEYPILPTEFSAYYVDGLLDPTRLDREVITQKKSKGDYFFAGQYGQTPIPLEGGMCHVDKIKVIEAPPERMGPTIRYWDKAGTGGGGAYTVGVKMGRRYDPGLNKTLYYILDVIRGQWDAGTREQIIEATAVRDGKNVRVGTEQEPGSGGKESAQGTQRRLAAKGYRCFIDKVTKGKHERLEPFAVMVNQELVRMVRAGWNDPYIDEMRNAPNSTYKDQADATSGAYAELAKAISVGAF